MSYHVAYQAIRDGDTGLLKRCVDQDPGLATAAEDRADWPGSTLLEHAVSWHRREMVEALVAAGAPKDRPGGKPPETALRRALGAGHATIADLLGPAQDLVTAAGVNDAEGVRARLPASEKETCEAFKTACRNGRAQAARVLCPEDAWFDADVLVEVLATHGHRIDHAEGETAYEWARSALRLANPLNVFDLETRDDRGRTVADAAREGGHEGLAGAIEKRQPSGTRRVRLDNAWRPGNTPDQSAFLFACQWGQTQRVRAFLAEDPSLVDSKTLWRMHAIYLPGAYGSDGSVETALILLDAGAEPYEGIGGACWWGATEVVLALLERGAPTGIPQRRESGLLHACAATRYNDPDNPQNWHRIIEGLLGAGADPNLADSRGKTPWGYAHDMTRPILEAHGAKASGHHPGLPEFQEALRSESDARVLELAAADPALLEFYDAEDSACSPALEAWLQGRTPLAERLVALKPGADLNEAAAFGDAARVRNLLDERGITGPRAGVEPWGIPLHIAAWCGHHDVVALLLARGYSFAAFNHPDVAGLYTGIPAMRDTTPLHLAAQAGHSAIVESFLDALDDHWSG